MSNPRPGGRPVSAAILFCTTCRALRFINFKTFSVWYWFRDRT